MQPPTPEDPHGPELGAPAPAPVLTVCVPSYNVEAYLERGLSSFDHDDLEAAGLEVVVVDDGSTDATAEVAGRFAARRPGVFRVLSKPNGGHGSAVNAGLAAARGRYFRVVDGDDWVNPQGLLELLGVLAGEEADLVVDVRRDVHMTSGQTEPHLLPAGLPRGAAVSFADVASQVTGSLVCMIHTLSLRTSFARAHNLRLLEHTFYVDSEFVIKATAAARTVRFCDIEVYQYLVGNAGQSVAAPNYVRRFADHDRVVREVVRFDRACAQEGGLAPAMQAYLDERARLIVNTHYNIMLVYDEDRPRGRARARTFRAWLAQAAPALEKATRGRYYQGLVAGRLGLTAQSMDRLYGRMRHEA